MTHARNIWIALFFCRTLRLILHLLFMFLCAFVFCFDFLVFFHSVYVEYSFSNQGVNDQVAKWYYVIGDPGDRRP